MLVNYFTREPHDIDWDGSVVLQSVPGRLDWKKIARPLPCGEGWVPEGFEFDGSSSGPFRFLIPKWRHPIASARHDWRCELIRQLIGDGMPMREAHRLRRVSDVLFREDLALGQRGWCRKFVETNAGYIGVRVGALFRIGMRP